MRFKDLFNALDSVKGNTTLMEEIPFTATISNSGRLEIELVSITLPGNESTVILKLCSYSSGYSNNQWLYYNWEFKDKVLQQLIWDEHYDELIDTFYVPFNVDDMYNMFQSTIGLPMKTTYHLENKLLLDVSEDIYTGFSSMLDRLNFAYDSANEEDNDKFDYNIKPLLKRLANKEYVLNPVNKLLKFLKSKGLIEDEEKNAYYILNQLLQDARD